MLTNTKVLVRCRVLDCTVEEKIMERNFNRNYRIISKLCSVIKDLDSTKFFATYFEMCSQQWDHSILFPKAIVRIRLDGAAKL